jgi:iron(III) transport system substrate-binding protein
MRRHAIGYAVTTLVLAVIATTAAFAFRRAHRPAQSTLVLYCATDREIAQDLIDTFQRQTGIRVDAKFDTESAKSVGLVQAIRQEKPHPRRRTSRRSWPMMAA